MTNITPADLAKFIHRVPVGATIPADTPFVFAAGDEVFGFHAGSWRITQTATCAPRWTAEPIPAPESGLALRAQELAIDAGQSVYTDELGSVVDRLALLVAELAERIEAKP